MPTPRPLFPFVGLLVLVLRSVRVERVEVPAFLALWPRQTSCCLNLVGHARSWADIPEGCLKHAMSWSPFRSPRLGLGRVGRRAAGPPDPKGFPSLR